MKKSKKVVQDIVEYLQRNKSNSNNIAENFIDGKNPEHKGDMARYNLKGKSRSKLKKVLKSDTASPRKKQLAHWYLNMHKEEYLSEDLRQWFKDKWVRFDTKGNIKGKCARDPGEGKPKCLPKAKALQLSKEKRAAAARRKRRKDPNPERQGKPINVRTEEYLFEKYSPTNSNLWSKAKSLAKSKFKVYPSAYANGWAAKWYKSHGGKWKKNN